MEYKMSPDVDLHEPLELLQWPLMIPRHCDQDDWLLHADVVVRLQLCRYMQLHVVAGGRRCGAYVSKTT